MSDAYVEIGNQVYALVCIEYRRRGLEPPPRSSEIKKVTEQLLAWADETPPIALQMKGLPE